MPNPIVYFEIVGKDKPVLEDFYTTVFDWQLTPNNARRLTRSVTPGECRPVPEAEPRSPVRLDPCAQ